MQGKYKPKLMFSIISFYSVSLQWSDLLKISFPYCVSFHMFLLFLSPEQHLDLICVY